MNNPLNISKISTIIRYLKRGRSEEIIQPSFQKRTPKNDIPSAFTFHYQRGGCYEVVKPTGSICVKKHFGKCLAGTSRCYGCGKNDHKVCACPKLEDIGREAK